MRHKLFLICLSLLLNLYEIDSTVKNKENLIFLVDDVFIHFYLLNAQLFPKRYLIEEP